MSGGAFDGGAYRREVLAALRDRSPAEIEDLFWLAAVDRSERDTGAIVKRLRETKGFLNKERSRPKQAPIATAVLKEWDRVEQTLTDDAARQALLARLSAAGAAPAPAPAPARKVVARATDPTTRRRRRTAEHLDELARLRDDPGLATDLFAFLGLPTTATPQLVAQRLDDVGAVNRRRRPDRERTLVDELLLDARALLVEAPPAAYLAALATDAAAKVVDALAAGELVTAWTALQGTRAADVADGVVLEALRVIATDHTGALPISGIGIGTWCPACGAVNGPGLQGCASCGRSLVVACEGCGSGVWVDSLACPGCQRDLAALRTGLAEQRQARAAETEALATINAAAPAERSALLLAAAAEHPSWSRVAALVAKLPPDPVGAVALEISGSEATLRWHPVADVDGYLVERVTDGAVAVLGQTSNATWTDHGADPSRMRWQVRVRRGRSVSEPVLAVVGSLPAAAGPARSAPFTPQRQPAAPTGLAAVGSIPVVLSWTQPAGIDVHLRRSEPSSGAERRLSVDAGGYRDRHVRRDTAYRYALWVGDQEIAGQHVELVAGSDARVTAAD